MKIEFSKHALEQMALRNLSTTVVLAILENPGEKVEENDKIIFQSIAVEDNKRYLIRIFVNNHRDPNLVITVYKTSKISKYYESKI